MTKQKHTTELVVFENSIGFIKEHHFSINGMKPEEIPLEDVVFIELREKYNFTLNRIIGVVAGCILLYGLILHFSSLISLLGFILLCVSLFLKRKEYFIQVTFRAIEVSFSRVKKNEKEEADAFIEKFYEYKSLLKKP